MSDWKGIISPIHSYSFRMGLESSILSGGAMDEAIIDPTKKEMQYQSMNISYSSLLILKGMGCFFWW